MRQNELPLYKLWISLKQNLGRFGAAGYPYGWCFESDYHQICVRERKERKTDIDRKREREREKESWANSLE